MSKEHQLTVGKKAMQQMYELFENHLYFTYSCILGKLFSRGVLGQKQMYRIKHTSDPDLAFHMLLDHLCEQDLENLLILVEVLYDSGEQDCLPGHTLLAKELKHHLNEPEKDAMAMKRTTFCALNPESSVDSVSNKSEPNPISMPTPVQATSEQPGNSTHGTDSPGNSSHDTDSLAVWEYPELMSSLLYFFEDNLGKGEATKMTPLSTHSQSCGSALSVHGEVKQKQLPVGHTSPSFGMPLIKFGGPLKSKTHGDLVIKLLNLGGSDPTKCNLVYQLIRGKKQLPIDLQIINVLGAVYATSDNAHLFQEALEWTKRPDCMNPVYLQFRLNYLLSICMLGSDRDLSGQYLKQAHELSAMCEPDYTTALVVMQEARRILFRVEEHHELLDVKTLTNISNISNKACEISRTLSEWMQPFTMIVTLLKIQLDARVALLLSKVGNNIGAIAAASTLSSLVREVEEPDNFGKLTPRQRATYHYVKAIMCVINRDRELAMTNAIKGCKLYLKVNSVVPARKIMEVVDEFV